MLVSMTMNHNHKKTKERKKANQMKTHTQHWMVNIEAK